jgi:hypothetical protein
VDQVWSLEDIVALLVLTAVNIRHDEQELLSMPSTPAFHSVNETQKAPPKRVHHNNNACPPGRDIPANERRSGTSRDSFIGLQRRRDCEPGKLRDSSCRTLRVRA